MNLSKFTQSFNNSQNSLKQPLKKIRKNWFSVLLVTFVLYVLFYKDISIQFQLSAANEYIANVFQQEPSLGNDKKSGGGAVALKVSDKNKKVEAKKLKDFKKIPNLTFVLSPDYAKRHGVPSSIVKQKIQKCQDYVSNFANIALAEKKKYGIPVSITLAQGLLESNVGESRLATESKNHFGIKCRSKCKGCTCRNYADDDVYDMFRVFETDWESYREHSILLSSSRYKHLLKLKTSDYEGWAKGLKKAGYATDKRYAEKLIQIIEELKLYKYDK
ncbi:MAG: glucosaminidase domain-containing protein [Bacteroidetes bacterium]|nr:glucosaminidase domain-containing protein [Bacteroidota bacterium]